jgi:hypothetical protein
MDTAAIAKPDLPRAAGHSMEDRASAEGAQDVTATTSRGNR